MHRRTSKILSVALCLLLIFQQTGFAQVVAQLDIAGHLTSLHNSIAPDRFRPLHLRYLQFNPQVNGFKLLIDKGDVKNLKDPNIEQATKDLLNYFFVGVTLPNDSFWVNLRPDSPDNIIDSALAQTDVGRILLEADLQLKKDTALYTSPQTPEGREYWDKLYKKAGELFGLDNVTIPTLTRPWIVPDEIIVREAQDNAYIYKATLKVMLEQDYLKDSSTYNFKDERSKQLNEYSSQLIRELIIPKLTKEVNTAKRYAPLRQVYYSLILAQWFKQQFAGKNTIYSSLIDRKNLTGLISKQDWSKTTYFQAYQKSFKDGEYNIKEPVYTPSGQTIRSYFSGGVALQQTPRQPLPAGEPLDAPTYTLGVSTSGTPDSLKINLKSPVESSSPAGKRNLELNKPSPSAREFVILAMRTIYGQFGVSPECINRIIDILFSYNQRDLDTVSENLRTYIGNTDFGTIYQNYEAGKSSRGRLSLIQRFITGHLVADIGSGSGDLSEAIIQNVSGVRRIIATDIGKYHRITNSLIEFRLQLLPDKIPIESNTVDTVVLSYMLHHVEASFQENLLKEINRILRKGGKVVILEDTYSTVLKPEQENELLERFLRLDNKQKKEVLALNDWLGNTVFRGLNIVLPFNYKSMEEWGDCFSNLGFSVEYKQFLGIPKGSFHFAPRGVFVLKKISDLSEEKQITSDADFSQRTPDSQASSAVGGIDFRNLPIVTQAISNLSAGISNMPNLNLNSEWQEIEKLVQSGIIPSGERMKEYLQVSCYQGRVMQDKKRVISCIADILRLQEEQYTSTEPILRDILVVLESGRSNQELRVVFTGTKF